nr:hypothetical protein [Candidatus Sigynarchaeum springense]
MAPSAAIVYQENFNSYSVGSYPSGWITYDNRLAGSIFDVNNTVIDSGNCLRISDNQTTDQVWARCLFPGVIPAGTLEFKVHVKGASTGSATMQYYVNLQDATNYTAFGINMIQNLTGNYWNIGIDAIVGGMNATQLNEDMTYSVKAVFGRGLVLGFDCLIINLYVNDVLFISNAYNLYRSINRMQVITNNPTNGSTWFFDTFVVTNSATGNVKPTITSPPDMNVVAGTTGSTITWTINDPDTSNPTYNVYNNGTLLTYLPVSWTSGMPIVFSLPALSGPQKANITIVATDGIDGIISDSVWVTVSENAPPVIAGIPSITIEYGSRINLTWTITDAGVSVPYYVITRNGSGVPQGLNTWTSGKPVQYNTTLPFSGPLPVGDYNFTITAYDGIGSVWLNSSYTTIVHVINTPPIATGLPSITIEFGSQENITWSIYDPSLGGGAYYLVYRNQTTMNATLLVGGDYWTSNSQIAQQNVTVLPALGSYNVTVIAFDGLGKNASFTTIVHVVNDLPPRVSTPSDISYAVGETGHSISWTITDYNMTAGWYAIYKDDVPIISNTTWTGPTQTVSINVDGLQRGQYKYRIVVSDGKTTSIDVVTVSVSDPVMDMIITVLVIAGVVVVVAAIIAARRKKKAGGTKMKRKVPKQDVTTPDTPRGKVITCPSCGTPFTLTSDYMKQYAGQKFKCTKCQADIPI